MEARWSREKEIEWARSNNFRNLVGIEVEEVAEGFARLSLEIIEKLLQNQNFAHGGVLATLVDGAIGTAARTVAPEDAEISTVEMNLNYLRPARRGRVVAEGRIVQSGKTLLVGTAEVKDEGGKLLVVGRATYIVVNRHAQPVAEG